MGVTTCCEMRNKEKDLLMRYTNFRHPPSRPFTDIRVHIKAPLDRNWYPRSGIVESFCIYDVTTRSVHAVILRGLLTNSRVQYRLPVFRLNKFRSPMRRWGPMSDVSHLDKENLHWVNDQ